jgi:hypothetical protein
MMNLFEIMQAAQGGRAVGNLSNQFGISPQQTTSALEALLPAFSMGLQNKTQSPDMFSQLAGMMTGAQAGQQAYEDANGDGIPDHLQQEGNQVLGQLFGSKEMSRAVADQASMASGVSSAVLKAMLPVVASMIMGGLFKSANNQGLGGILGQLAQGMGGQPGGGFGQQPSSNPIGDLIGSMMGGGQAQPQRGGGGMGDMLGGLMGAMMGGAQGQPQPRTQQAGFDPATMGLEALTGMFDTGRKVQDQHQANLQSIFDAFLKR